MEMRKFIVEIHPDGRVYATEYEEPSECHYDRCDIRDALRQLDIECCSEMATAYRNNERYALNALDRVERLIDLALNTYWH